MEVLHVNQEMKSFNVAALSRSVQLNTARLPTSTQSKKNKLGKARRFLVIFSKASSG